VGFIYWRDFHQRYWGLAAICGIPGRHFLHYRTYVEFQARAGDTNPYREEN